MKKCKGILIVVVIIYSLLSLLLFAVKQQENEKGSLAYKVEIHEVMRQLERGAEVAALTMSEYRFLQDVTFLDKDDVENISDFYANKNNVYTSVNPLYQGNELKGYVRFDYVLDMTQESVFLWAEGILFLTFLLIIVGILYIYFFILKPFHDIKELPYELSKGHLKVDLYENKNRFFGQFIWGLGMLKDTLSDSKAKELKLLKEKKLLLLSLSHDIKIPLSAIKLYTKALKENIYDSEEKKQDAVQQIEEQTRKIEEYVKEIMSASSEEIISIEVQNAEFYLQDFVEKIHALYQSKAEMQLLQLEIGSYENKLLHGDIERAVEVMENLLENAFKYGDGKQIRIHFYEEDYCQVIQVFNTGEQVPYAEMPHLFDSFYRGSNATDKQGNGLGLYISRQIMHKMNGELFAERQEEGMGFGIVFQMA